MTNYYVQIPAVSGTVSTVNGTAFGAGGSLTTDHVLKATGAATADFGAFNPAVMTIASQAIGDILYASSTTAWARLGTSTVGKALIAGGTGVAPSWATDFGANNLVTTGIGSFGTTPAGAGEIRLPNNGNGIQWRNAANNANFGRIYVDNSDQLQVTATTALITGTSNLALCGGTVSIRESNASACVYFVPSSSSVTMKTVEAVAWLVTQDARTGDNATKDFVFLAQNASASGTTAANKKGADYIFKAGARTSTAGKRGGFKISMNGVATENMIEVCDVQPEATDPSRVISICRPLVITTTEHPSLAGDLVENIGPCAAIPTASPGGNSLVRYVTGGDQFKRTSAGHQQSMGPSAKTRAFPSDANYTAVLADYSATTLELVGGSTLTATRDVVVPLTLGFQWTIVNNTTGAQSIRVIGVSGTGITVATGKTAIVRADGTNVVRVTADT